jgi:hypothetical protein
MLRTPKALQAARLVLAATAFALGLSGCGGTAADPPPLHPSAAANFSCSSGQPFQHASLPYHLCFPASWSVRDYTAEPGSGGALSVVAFGPRPSVPDHISSLGQFAPPIEVRVESGSKTEAESSSVEGNQVSPVTVAGTPADRVTVVDNSLAQGSVIVFVEHEGNTYEIVKAPGVGYQAQFDSALASFGFSSSTG